MRQEPNVSSPKRNVAHGSRHQSASDQGNRQLYVWFHGLFGFYLKKDHIVAVTPYMEEHSYRAGPWMKEKPLKAGEWYRLRGVSASKNPNSTPEIDATRTAVLSGVPKVDFDNSYFLIRLGFPKRLIPVRYVSATFSGSASRQLHTPFPLVNIFQYDVMDPDALSLDSFDGWPRRHSRSPIINLHVFAEPEKPVLNEHAMHAFESLIQLFPGTDLQLSDVHSSPPVDPNVPDGNLPAELDPMEELSLSERIAKSGAQPANCFALIVRNS